nr:CHASE2 and HATPase_c domain-containing protein [Novosphingobium piscinae]
MPAGLRWLGRRRRDGWLTVLACLLGATALEGGGLVARLDHIAYDALLGHRPPPPTDRILIVAIDARSLTAIGAWPWPRQVQAELVRRLSAARPQAIGIDVLLTEPRDPAGDAALAEALAEAGNVYLPLAFELPGRNGRAVDVLRPLPAFVRASAGLGHVNLSPDSDGVMRTGWRTYQADGTGWPALPAAMLGQPADRAPPASGLTRAAPLMIDYPGSAGTLASVPAAAVLRGEVPAALIAGKLVLVGMTASGLGDMHATPLSADAQLMPGVEIQGSLLATLLAPRQLIPASPALQWAFALAPVLALFAGLAWLPSRRGLAWTALLAIGVVAISAGGLILGNLWLRPAVPLVALAVSYAVWSWRRLAVASGMVSAELERASREAGLPAPPPAAGMLDRQIDLLTEMTARERALRHEHESVVRLLSHDMRAPQSAILALLDQGGGCPPDLATRIGAHARRTLELADGFVHLARAQAVAPGTELIDLRDLAIEAADALWPQAQSRGIALRTPDDAAEVLVRGDRSLLARVLVNLLDNAIKYGAAGTPVTIGIATLGDQAEVTVRNHGPDIPADQLDRIFESFAQAPGRGRRADGVGLGLAFVHTVVTRHGGTVTCRSAGGETGFSLALPAAQP